MSLYPRNENHPASTLRQGAAGGCPALDGALSPARAVHLRTSPILIDLRLGVAAVNSAEGRVGDGHRIENRSQGGLESLPPCRQRCSLSATVTHGDRDRVVPDGSDFGCAGLCVDLAPDRRVDVGSRSRSVGELDGFAVEVHGARFCGTRGHEFLTSALDRAGLRRYTLLRLTSL